jgi:putative ABC transport system ATP-binding protein
MNADREAAVEVSDLHKDFGAGETRVQALRGLDLVVHRGEFLAIMGPSGSGKSTLLHLLAGLDPPSSGRIVVGGQDLAALDDDALTLLRRRSIGLIFQAFNLLQVLTAEENVALPLIIGGAAEAEAQRRARACLQLVGAAHRAAHYPPELSGGEQQRVAIARALCAQPVLLLADEPSGNLDSQASEQIIALLRELVDRQGQTVVMVTHDAGHAAMADRLVRLRDGRVEEEQILPRGRSAAEVLRDLEASL